LIIFLLFVALQKMEMYTTIGLRVFEVSFMVLGAATLYRAWKTHSSHFFFALGALFYGLLLEVVTIYAHHAYAYSPDHLFMIGPVPLWIGVGWCIILYAAMLLTDAAGIPVLSQPLVDALVAVSLDLGLDPVAVELGAWRWLELKPYAEYFGVPWGNFFGWWMVAWSYGIIARLALVFDVSFCTCEGAPLTPNQALRRNAVRMLGVVPAALFVCSIGVGIMATLAKRNVWAGPAFFAGGVVLSTAAAVASGRRLRGVAPLMTRMLFGGMFAATAAAAALSGAGAARPWLVPLLVGVGALLGGWLGDSTVTSVGGTAAAAVGLLVRQLW
jgi:uncharacterized membrane protein